MQPTLTLVYPANIAAIWPQVLPLLQPVLALHNTHNPEDVRKALLCGNAQLWIQWNDKAEAAVVTEFINYPKGLWFRLWLAGAEKKIKVLWLEFFKILEEFAKNNNCKGIEECGREGWLRYAPKETKRVFGMRRILF